MKPKGSPGERNCKAKLTNEQVRAIRTSPEPNRVLASRYGVGSDTIWAVRARKTWKDIDDPNDVPATPTVNAGERWLPVPITEYAERYEVSNYGYVRRPVVHLPRPTMHPVSSPQGYAVVVLRRANKSKRVFVHRLVAMAFLGPVPPGHGVNHKDGNKTNNRTDNLEYVTPKQNSQHASRLRLMAFGTRNNKAKVTDDQVREIRQSRETNAALGRRYGLHPDSIYRIKHRESWPHLS